MNTDQETTESPQSENSAKTSGGSDETFDWKKDINSLEAARRHLRKRTTRATPYSFYTTVDRSIRLLETRRLWLTRLDAEEFDDGIEHKKYGDKSVASRLFIKCFQFGRQESAAMWGLYCPPAYQAIRVSISWQAFDELARQPCFPAGEGKESSPAPDVVDKWVQDIVYASVVSADERSNESQREIRRANALWYDGEYSNPIADLPNQISAESATGIVKDAEWRFENESRLFVQVKEPSREKHIAVAFPDSAIESISFTLSPWASDEEQAFVTDRLSVALLKARRKDSKLFRKSVLQDGLKKWAERRGLD